MLSLARVMVPVSAFDSKDTPSASSSATVVYSNTSAVLLLSVALYVIVRVLAPISTDSVGGVVMPTVTASLMVTVAFSVSPTKYPRELTGVLVIAMSVMYDVSIAASPRILIAQPRL